VTARIAVKCARTEYAKAVTAAIIAKMDWILPVVQFVELVFATMEVDPGITMQSVTSLFLVVGMGAVEPSTLGPSRTMTMGA
jgi:hypothetical protein